MVLLKGTKCHSISGKEGWSLAKRERFLSLDGDKRAQSLPTTWPASQQLLPGTDSCHQALCLSRDIERSLLDTFSYSEYILCTAGNKFRDFFFIIIFKRPVSFPDSSSTVFCRVKWMSQCWSVCFSGAFWPQLSCIFQLIENRLKFMPDLKANVFRLLSKQMHSASSHRWGERWSDPSRVPECPGLAESVLGIFRNIALVLN